MAAMEETEMSVPLVGLAKQFEHMFLPNEPDPVILPRNSQALFMVQRIRDEAHRFANTFQAQLRGKKQTKSTLDDIPGIGPKRRRALQMHFATISRLRGATVEEIATTPGAGLDRACRLCEHWRSSEIDRLQPMR